MKVSECVENFNSPHFSQRALAVDFLFKAKDKLTLNELEQYFNFEERAEFSTSFVNHLLDLARNVDSDMTPFAISKLLKFRNQNSSEKEDISISNTIEDIFYDIKVNKHYKSFLLSKIWRNLNLDNRRFLTQIITKVELTSSAKLLLYNFESNDKELIVDTLRAFSVFRDSRANEYIEELLKSDDLTILQECLRTLSRTGGFFSAKHIRKFIYSEDLELARIAVRAYRRMKGRYGLKLLLGVYESSEDSTFKIIVIKEIARIPSLESFNFLLHHLDSEAGSKLRSVIEASTISHGYPRRDRALVNFCKSQPRESLCAYLELFEHLNSPRSFSYIISLVQDSSQSELVRALSIELLGQYYNHKSLDVLGRTVKGGDRYLATIAFDTILKLYFKANPTDVSGLIPSTKNLVKVEHSMFIRYARKVEFSTEDKDRVIKYLLRVMNSNDIDNRLSAISAFQDLHNENSFLELLKAYTGENDIFFKDSILKSMRRIIYNTPKAVELRFLALVPDELFDNLDAFLIADDLLERILLFLEHTENPLLSKFLIENKKMLNVRVAKIIEKSTSEHAGALFWYSSTLGYSFKEGTLNFLKPLLSPNSKYMKTLVGSLIRSGSLEHFDFLLNNFDEIQGDLRVDFYQNYLEELV